MAEPNTDVATPTPSPAPTQAAPTPPQSTPQATPPAIKPNAAPVSDTTDLDPNQILSFGHGDQMVDATLGDLVAAKRFMLDKSDRILNDQDAEQFALFKKVLSGDPEATRVLVEQYVPKSEPQAPEPGSVEARLVAMQQELGQVKQQLHAASTTTRQIEDLKMAGQIKTLIDGAKEKVPYLAHHPQAPNMVAQSYKMALSGFDQSKLTSENRWKVLSYSMSQIEQALKQNAEIYRDFKGVGVPVPGGNSQQPTKPGSGVVVVDDQGAPKLAASVPPAVIIRDGVAVDIRGRPVAQTSYGPFNALPETPITDVPVGGASPAQPQLGHQRGQPITKDQMLQQLASRREELDRNP